MSSRDETILKGQLKWGFVSSLVFLVLLSASFASWQYNRSETIKAGLRNFENRTEQLTMALEGGLHQLEELTRFGGLLLNGERQVSRHDFVELYEKASEDYQVINGIVYVEKVVDKTSFTEKVKNDMSLVSVGYPQFKVFPDEGTDGDRWVISYLTNYQKNKALFGYDVKSSERWWKIMEEAGRKGEEVVISQRLLLNTETAALVRPIYNKDNEKKLSDKERQSSLVGFVMVMFDPAKLDSAWKEEKDTEYYIQASLYDKKMDDKDKTSEAIMTDFFGFSDPNREKVDVNRQDEIRVANEVWTVRYGSSYALNLNWYLKYLPFFIFVIDTIKITALTVLIYIYFDQRERLELLG